MKLFPSPSLKTRVTLLTLAIFLAYIWSLAFYASGMLRQDMQRLLGEQQFSTVSLIASDVNQELYDRLRALENVAARVTPAVLGQAALIQAFLEDRPVLRGLFNGGIAALGVDGTVIADVPLSAGRIGVNYMDVDVASAAALKEGKSTIGRPVMGKKLHAPVFVMVVPIRNAQGRVVGALAGVINLGLHNFLDKITQNNYGKSGSYLLVAPRYRLVVTASDKSRIMATLPAPGVNAMMDRYSQGHEGTDVFINPVGEEVLASVKSVPVAGWYVAVALPTAEAFAPIRTMQQHMLMAAMVLTLLAAALIWWMLRRQLAPLLAAARSLAARSDTAHPPLPLPVTSEDEIGQLIGSFNQLLTTLSYREDALRETKRFLRESQSIAGLGSFVLDLSSGRWKSSDVFDQIFGIGPAYERTLEGWVARIHPADRVMLADYLGDEILRQGQDLDREHRILRHDDRALRWVHGLGRLEFDAQGRALKLHGTVQDITARKVAEERLQLAASVFSHAREGIMITEPDGTIIDVNEAFSQITGYSREEALGHNPRLLRSTRQGPEFYAAMWRELLALGHWYGEIWNRRKNGETYAEMLTISAVRDDQGSPRHYVALFSDITALKAHQSQLEHSAHYDALTGLPNRVLLADRLQQGMAQAQRHGQLLAVAYLDLDGFKAVNDQHGHAAGDQLLVAVASRMKQALREGDSLARLGGDEFVAVLLDLADIQTSVPTLSRLLAAAAQPLQFGEHLLQVSASLGVTFYPQAQDMEADQLLRQADHAMYQAKLAGRNRYQVFGA